MRLNVSDLNRLVLVAIMGLSLSAFGKDVGIEDAQVCDIRLQSAIIWNPTATSTFATSDVNNINDGDIATNWYSAGVLGGPDITTFTLCNDDQADYVFTGVELIPETEGGFGFEQVRVYILNSSLGTTEYDETYSLLPTGAVDLEVFIPAGTIGDCVQLDFINHIDPTKGGVGEIRVYSCYDTVACEAQCPGSGTDSDGDGLSNSCEDCLGTEKDNADTDDDGMPDGYEFELRHEPLVFDGRTDMDIDGLNNVEEFQVKSNPRIEDSPHVVLNVDDTGLPNIETGSDEYPFQTVAAALAHATAIAKGIDPIVIDIRKGVYDVDGITIPDNIIIRGFQTASYLSFLNNESIFTIFEGEVTTGSNNTLRRIVFRATDDNKTLLTIDDDRTTVRNCIFIDKNNTYNAVTGIEVYGSQNAEDSRIYESDFVNMDTGIHLFDGIPAIFSNDFVGTGNTHIFISDNSGKGEASAPISALGDPERPGLNKFDGSSSDIAVENNRAEEIQIEVNDWGTDDLDEVDDRIDGPADFEPILATGSSVLAGSLFVTVIDGLTTERVLDATVSLAVSPYPAVGENEDGVYSFAAVLEDSYVVTVEAEDFDPVTREISIASGELLSIVITMGIEEAKGGGGCATLPKGSSGRWSDVIVLIGALAFLWGYRTYRQRKVNA